MLHSKGSYIYLFDWDVPRGLHELDVEPFFKAIWDRDTRFNLIYNMIDLS